MKKTALFATNPERKVKSKAGDNNGKEETVHEINQDDRRTADRVVLSLSSSFRFGNQVRDARQPAFRVEKLFLVSGCR